jgi:hypothetical protein
MSAFYSRTPTGLHGPTCVFWANRTPRSLDLEILQIHAIVADRTTAATRSPAFMVLDASIHLGLCFAPLSAGGLSPDVNAILTPCPVCFSSEYLQNKIQYTGWRQNDCNVHATTRLGGLAALFRGLLGEYALGLRLSMATFGILGAPRLPISLA